jgi:hypothetical protein
MKADNAWQKIQRYSVGTIENQIKAKITMQQTSPRSETPPLSRSADECCRECIAW